MYTHLLSNIKKNKKLKLIHEHEANVNRTECQLEWEQLNEHVYVRRTTVYHFTDLNELRFTLFRHPQFKMYKYILIVTVISQETTVEYMIDKLNELWHSGRVTISASFKIMTKTNIKVKMKVCMEQMQNCTKYPLDVIVKRFVPLETEREQFQHSAICTEAYYFNVNKIQALEWWMQINQLNGYNQMIMSNHSMGNGNDEFEKLFLKYNKFVQLNQLQCYPNFYGNQSQIIERPFVRLNELKKLYNTEIWPYLHTVLEEYVFNECYTANRNKYKYITITDQDESIAPRGLLNTTIDLFHSDHQDYKQLITNYQCYNNNNNNSKLESYLNSLLSNLNITKKHASFYFKMSLHLKNKTADLIFKQLGSFLTSLNETKPINYTILIQDVTEISAYGAKLKFWFSIRNKDELDYAKRIYKFHTELMEPILRKNKQILDKVAAESFNRVYILFGQNSTGFLYGKTIHNTITTDILNTHFGGPTFDIPVEYGHLSHFREIYHINWGVYPITELMFDFNYYNCYFKPVIKQFGSDFKEF